MTAQNGAQAFCFIDMLMSRSNLGYVAQGHLPISAVAAETSNKVFG
jgi:hypothetical protein